MKITDKGVCRNDRGANHNVRLLWYAPGVNPNDKTVMINPPGRTTVNSYRLPYSVLGFKLHQNI